LNTHENAHSHTHTHTHMHAHSIISFKCLGYSFVFNTFIYITEYCVVHL